MESRIRILLGVGLVILLYTLGNADLTQSEVSTGQAGHPYCASSGQVLSGVLECGSFEVPADAVVRVDGHLVISSQGDIVILGDLIGQNGSGTPSGITLEASRRVVIDGSVRTADGADGAGAGARPPTVGQRGGNLTVVAPMIAGTGLLHAGKGGLGGPGLNGGDGGSVILMCELIISSDESGLTARGGRGGNGGDAVAGAALKNGGDGGQGGSATVMPLGDGAPGSWGDSVIYKTCSADGQPPTSCSAPNGGSGVAGLQAIAGNGGDGGDGTAGGDGGDGGGGGKADAGCGGDGADGMMCSPFTGNGGHGGAGGTAYGGNGGRGGNGSNAVDLTGAGHGGDGGKGGNAWADDGGDGGNGANGLTNRGGRGGNGGNGGNAIGGDGGDGGAAGLGAPVAFGGAPGLGGTVIAGGGGLGGVGGSGIPMGTDGTDGTPGTATPGANGLPGSDGYMGIEFAFGHDNWRFANTESNMFPASWYQQFDYSNQEQYPSSFSGIPPWVFPDWSSWVSAYGEDECYWTPGVPTSVRSSARNWWYAWVGRGSSFGYQGWAGSCYGFAVSDFLFRQGLLDLPTEFPFYTALYDVPIAGDSRHMVNSYYAHQTGWEHYNYIWDQTATTTPTETVNELQLMFRYPGQMYRALLLWGCFDADLGESDLYGICGGHAVNPYRLELDDVSHMAYIYVYDNNYPDDNSRRVEVDLDAQTWSYTLSGWITWSGTGGGLLLTEPMEGFVTRPDLPIFTPPTPTIPVADGGTSTTRTAIMMDASMQTELTAPDASLGVIGDSVFANNLTAGGPIIPITGAPTKPIGFVLEPRTWDITWVRGFDSIGSIGVFTPGTAQFLYRRHDPPIMSLQRMRYEAGTPALWVFAYPQDTVHHAFEYTGVFADSEWVVRIENIRCVEGDSIRYLESPSKRLSIENPGRATEYDLTVRIQSAAIDSEVTHTNISLNAHATHQICPDWRPYLDSIQILIDVGMDGQFEDTVRYSLVQECTCPFQVDLDGNSFVNAVDLAFVIDIVFFGSPDSQDPDCSRTRADFDANGFTDAVDLAFLIDHVFFGQPGPVDPCGAQGTQP